MARYSNGWIKLYRSVADSDIGSDAVCLGIWVKLLSWASWQESKISVGFQQNILPPGSVLIGVRSFAEDLNISKDTMYRWLKYLELTGRITRKSRHRGTIVTICNWDKYQIFENEAATDQRQISDTNKPLIKKRRKKKEENTSRFDLEIPYQQYPRHEGKSAGMRTLVTEITSQIDYDNFCTAVQNYSRRCQEMSYEVKYIKLFSSFVSEWRDWIDSSPHKTQEFKFKDDSDDAPV